MTTVPLYFQQDINEFTRLGVWQIAEAVDFFQQKVSFRYPVAHTQKQLQHLAAGYLLPVLYPDFPYQSIETLAFRKPYIPGNPYFFSLSHCSGYAAAIVSSSDSVGIDIETISPRVQRIRHKFLSREENLWVCDFTPAEQDSILTLLWSIKETVYKWLGQPGLIFNEHIRIHPINREGIQVAEVTLRHPDYSKQVQVFFIKLGGMYCSFLVDALPNN
ncbi:MAG: 4'-phosphopantetheinyl transferase superfamily protein [Sediminibacterium sp.]|nr:4'-phosphopantetheinyl transferase superfamily protein [Sediminibacterium sp.]